jgi:outer membrane autotransporter protein
VLALPGTYTSPTDYLILDAGSRTGAFGGVVDNSAFLDFALDHNRDANQVWLTLTMVADFPDVVETPNQLATSAAAQFLGGGNPIYAALIALDAATARNAFDLLSGEIHPSLRALLFDESGRIRDSVTDRIRQAFADIGVPLPADTAIAFHGGPAEERITAWGRVHGAFGEIEGDGNAATLDHASGGVFLGADRAALDHWRFGFAAGYTHSEADVAARASDASIDTAEIALYGGARYGALGLRFGSAYAWHGVETERRIAFPGFAATATADYGASTWQAFGEAGYEIEVGAARIEPFLQLGYVATATDGFTENDAAAALTASSAREDYVLATLGLHGAGDFMLASGRRIEIDGTLAWRHVFGDAAPATTFAFNGGAGLPFVISGVPIARDAALADIGLALAISEQTRLRFGYSGEIAGNAQNHGLNGDLTLRF